MLSSKDIPIEKGMFDIAKAFTDIMYDLPLTNTVAAINPAVFAKPWAGRKPHIFFANSVAFAREIVELMERLDATWDNITYDRYWDKNKWGIGDFYDKRGGIWDFELVNRNLEIALTSDVRYDVMVIPGKNGWGGFTQRTREAVMKRVQDGCGLILIQPFDGEEYEKTDCLKQLSPLRALYEEGLNEKGYPAFAIDRLKSDKWIAEDHYITHGIPFDILPTDILAYYPYEAAGDVILRAGDSGGGAPIAAVKTYGKGRVAAFGYFNRDILPQQKDYGELDCFSAVTDSWGDPIFQAGFNYVEYFYRLIGRAILWAGRCEAASLDVTYSAQDTARDANPFRVTFDTSSALRPYVAIKNSHDDNVLNKTEFTADFRLPASLHNGGGFRAEFSLEGNGAVADFFTVPFRLPARACLDTLSLNEKVLSDGSLLHGKAIVSGNGGVKTVIRLFDAYDRLLDEVIETIDMGKAADTKHEIPFVFCVSEFKAIYGYVTATLYINDFTVEKKRTKNFIVTAADRDLHDFETFLIPVNKGHGDLLPYTNLLFPKAGLSGAYIGDSHLMAQSGGRGLGVYWYHRAPYVEKKEQYMRTRDKKYLERTPCLNDDSFWANIDENITRTVGINRKFGPISYYAQDEGSLTCYSDELELCFCHHCMNKMHEWLKEIYGSLEAVNESWNTAFTAWEDVIPYTKYEARKTGDYASWGDHRRFMEITYANAYRNFRDMINKSDPGGRVRMSGCQASTAYSGNDYDLLHQYVRYFEAYSVGSQYEFHRSFRQPGTILGGWFGYGASGLNVQHRLWYALYHNLTLISIFWEPCMLNPDFSFSQSAIDMGEVFREIRREGIGKLLLYAAKQDTLGIALHYSMASVHGTSILSRRADFENNRTGWLNVLEDMGYQYRFVSSRQVENAELMSRDNKINLLILPYSVALSDKEAEEIRKFVKSGGVVIGDVQTGLMDEHCKLGEFGRLDDVFGITRLNTDCEMFYVNKEFMANPDFTYFENTSMMDILEMAEIGVRAETGVNAFYDDFSQHVAAVTVNGYGQGKGVYLNFMMKDYPEKLRRADGGIKTRELLHKIIELSQVRKPAQVVDINNAPLENGVESYYYTLGGSRFFCIQRDLNKKLVINYDGLVNKSAEDEETISEAIGVKLNKTYHVYDVRKQTYLGETDNITGRISNGSSNIYALLPYRAVEMLRVSTEAPDIISAELRVEGAAPEHCVFAVNVWNPGGEYSVLYSRNIITNGLRAEYKIPFAKNDILGEWKVTVKDVATGTQCEIPVNRW